MHVVRIEKRDDPRLADYAGVRDPGPLRERGLLIAEGRFVVRRLLDTGRAVLRSLLLNEAARAGLADALLRAPADLTVYVAPREVIASATGFDIHRGCLALAERPAPLPLAAVLATADPIVVLERVADADNVGAVFRNAEAFGAGGVLLSPGCGDPLYRKALRTSSGAALMVPFAAAEPWPDVLTRLTAAGFVLAALTPAGSATDIGEFVRTPEARNRLALLAGTEGAGLTPDVLERADVRLRIPMSPTLDSLNVATAVAIALHRVREARTRARAVRRPTRTRGRATRLDR